MDPRGKPQLKRALRRSVELAPPAQHEPRLAVGQKAARPDDVEHPQQLLPRADRHRERRELIPAGGPAIQRCPTVRALAQ